MKDIWELVNFSTTIPIVLPFWLKISSPIIKSEVVPVAPLMEERTIKGADGFDVFEDSKIPWISMMSGKFNEIFLSWTLVPYA